MDDDQSQDLRQELQGSSPAEPPPPEPPLPPSPAPEVGGLAQTQKTPDERKALLANTLQGQVAGGARIESQGDFQAVVVKGHRTNHLLHFFVGVFTLGLWWIVWFFIAVFGGEKRHMITVDELGNTFVQSV
jgi:hypothetical protein